VAGVLIPSGHQRTNPCENPGWNGEVW
jgi:hypothetical protein